MNTYESTSDCYQSNIYFPHKTNPPFLCSLWQLSASCNFSSFNPLLLSQVFPFAYNAEQEYQMATVASNATHRQLRLPNRCRLWMSANSLKHQTPTISTDLIIADTDFVRSAIDNAFTAAAAGVSALTESPVNPQIDDVFKQLFGRNIADVSAQEQSMQSSCTRTWNNSNFLTNLYSRFSSFGSDIWLQR